MNWTDERKIIPTVVTNGIGPFSSNSEKRGILSFEEGDGKNNFGTKLAYLVAWETCL